MFKELKLKMATRRVAGKNNNRATSARRRTVRKKSTFWTRVWNIICWPFRMIARIIRRIWRWIRNIDLIGLVNLTLLIAIIILFLMLIIDIVGCRKNNIVVVTDAPAIAIVPEQSQVTITDESAPAGIKSRPSLPLKRDVVTRKFKTGPVTAANNGGAQAQPQTELYGDVIIDRRGATPILANGVKVHGSLYLQNMRKYTLPCGAVIDGNLFLRNVEMLQFCGDFTVKGNIYVSPQSSFGPIPRTAKLGGQIIL